MTPSVSKFLAFLLFVVLPSVENSEICKFEGPLDAASGYVDLSGLRLKNNDDGIPSDVSGYAARPVNGSVVGDDEYLIELDDDKNYGGRKLARGRRQYGVNI